jgi:hypothetical protein
MSTQNHRILSTLKRRPLTAVKALRQLGCLRLAARIKELRDDGYLIRTELVRVRTRDGYSRIARYSLV